MESYTTPMYRPPEIVDPYLQYEVTSKVDIWMLGCLIYTLCYFIHPFIDANAVGIASAVYRFPSETKYKVSEKMKDFIRILLTPNPQNRPGIQELVKIIGQWDNLTEIPLNSEAK